MNKTIEAARLRAEASFKAPRDGSAPGPLQTAQAAELQVVLEKTARLKAMRLARDATLRTDPPAKTPRR